MIFLLLCQSKWYESSTNYWKKSIFLSSRFQNFSNIDKRRVQITSGVGKIFRELRSVSPLCIWNPRVVSWYPHSVDCGITVVLRSALLYTYVFLSARLHMRTHKGIHFLATAIPWTLASPILSTLLWKAFLNISSLALLIDSHLPFP